MSKYRTHGIQYILLCEFYLIFWSVTYTYHILSNQKSLMFSLKIYGLSLAFKSTCFDFDYLIRRNRIFIMILLIFAYQTRSLLIRDIQNTYQIPRSSVFETARRHLRGQWRFLPNRLFVMHHVYKVINFQMTAYLRFLTDHISISYTVCIYRYRYFNQNHFM